MVIAAEVWCGFNTEQGNVYFAEQILWVYKSILPATSLYYNNNYASI